MINILTIFSNIEIAAPQKNYIPLILWILIVVNFRQYLKRKKILIYPIGGSIFLLLIITSAIITFYVLPQNENSMTGILQYFVMPILVYVIGYVIVRQNYARGDNYIYYIVICALIGCAIHALINIPLNIGASGDRFGVKDFFTGEILSATNQGTVNTLIFSVFPCLIILSTEKRKKIFACVLLAISIVYGMIIGSRTTFVILFVEMFMITILYILNTGKDVFKKTITKFFLLFPIVALIFAFIYSFNVFGIQTLISNSNLLEYTFVTKSNVSDTYRLYLLISGINNFFTSALGPQQTTINYYHNYWLDIARVAGYVPAILTIIMDVIIVRHSYKNFKNKESSKLSRYFGIAITVGFLLNFSVEPILDGYLNVYYRFIFFVGIIESIYTVNKRKANIIESL